MSQGSETPGLLLEAAAAWLARLHADDCSIEDRRAFDAWVSAAPAHAAAYRYVADMYAISGELRDLRPAEAAPPAPSRRALWAGGAVVAAAAAAGLFVWTRPSDQAYATEIGQQRRIALEDGAILLLDTDTAVEIRRQRGPRVVQLARGRANLDLPQTGARATEIAVSDWRVLAHAGSVDVRCEGSVVSMFVIAGDVSLSRADGYQRNLRAGQRLSVGADGIFEDTPSPDAATAWQRAQLVFEGQTLGVAVAELNRYSRVTLRVADEATANLKISGVYSVGDNAAFARSVSILLPVTPRVRDGEILLAPSARNSSPQGG